MPDEYIMVKAKDAKKQVNVRLPLNIINWIDNLKEGKEKVITTAINYIMDNKIDIFNVEENTNNSRSIPEPGYAKPTFNYMRKHLIKHQIGMLKSDEHLPQVLLICALLAMKREQANLYKPVLISMYPVEFKHYQFYRRLNIYRDIFDPEDSDVMQVIPPSKLPVIPVGCTDKSLIDGILASLEGIPATPLSSLPIGTRFWSPLSAKIFERALTNAGFEVYYRCQEREIDDENEDYEFQVDYKVK